MADRSRTSRWHETIEPRLYQADGEGAPAPACALLLAGVPSSPSILRAPLRYLAALRWPKLILWCYLCWYGAMVALHFDPAPRLWLSSLGISALIGVALILSTSGAGRAPDGWTTFRLFLMPFCVSSYAALIKDQGFVLLFSPSLKENLICLALCAGFLAAHRLARLLDRSIKL